MSESKISAEQEAWEELVEALATGRLPILEVMKSGGPLVYKEGDYLGFVTFTRAWHVLMGDKRIVRRLLTEITAKTEKVFQGKKDLKRFNDIVKSKDGFRLMDKLGTVHAEMYADGPSLLSGKTFEECLGQYHRLINHVENLWKDACRIYKQKNYPLSTFISILAVEEIGKLGRLWYDLLAWDWPPNSEKKDLGRLGRDHHKKHFMGVISGAVVNSRLDRILGKKHIKQLLQDVESGKLEGLRQACLYIDIHDGKIMIPSDIVNEETAKFFAVLAGELWAEVLGHFPWDFEKMFSKVKRFEVAIGLEKKDTPRD